MCTNNERIFGKGTNTTPFLKPNWQWYVSSTWSKKIWKVSSQWLNLLDTFLLNIVWCWIYSFIEYTLSSLCEIKCPWLVVWWHTSMKSYVLFWWNIYHKAFQQFHSFRYVLKLDNFQVKKYILCILLKTWMSFWPKISMLEVIYDQTRNL